MTGDDPKVGDLAGIKPIGEAIKIATQAVVDGATAILSRICLPVAEEIGLSFRDKVSAWRAQNLLKIMKKLEGKMVELKIPEGMHAHPRIAHSIAEQGSWADDSIVQDLWAGLLASSCTKDGEDDSNLVFVNLLSGLTKLQAKVVKYACEAVGKSASPSGLIQPTMLAITIEQLQTFTGEKDINRLDRELDYLRGVSLITGGILSDSSATRIMVNLTPTPLALHMYVRCQGSRGSPLEFFKVPPVPEQPDPPTIPASVAQ